MFPWVLDNLIGLFRFISYIPYGREWLRREGRDILRSYREVKKNPTLSLGLNTVSGVPTSTTKEVGEDRVECLYGVNSILWNDQMF